MITVLLLLAVLVTAIVVATVRTVTLDGYRARPDRSWSAGMELPPATMIDHRLS